MNGQDAMYGEERQHAIWQRIQRDGRVGVAELSDEFGVAAETIRRDLSALEGTGLVKRVHGGAVPANRLVFESSLEDRSQVMTEEKDRIAVAALDELPTTGAVFIDAGSTTARLVEHIPMDSELTVITNSITAAVALVRFPRLTVMTIGGRVRSGTLAEVDDWALRNLSELRVDVAFVGANAVSVERGLATPDPAEAAVKRAIIHSGERNVLLTDHTKFGAVSLLTFAELTDLDAIITGKDLDDEVVAEIEATGVAIARA